jgi:hypothetical protein
VLVLDASDPPEEMARRLRSSLRILWEFDGRPDEEAPPAALEMPPSIARGGAAEADIGGDALDGTVPTRVAPTTVEASGHATTWGKPFPAASPVPLESASTMVPPVMRSTGPGGATSDGAGFIVPRSDTAASQVIVPMRRGLAPILVALNKTDRLAPGELESKVRLLERDGLLDPAATVAISAATGEGLTTLFERLYEMLPDYDEYEMAFPSSPEAEALIAWIHDHADVLDLTRGNEVHLHFEAKRSLRATLLARCAAVGATPLRESLRAPVDEIEDGPR